MIIFDILFYVFVLFSCIVFLGLAAVLIYCVYKESKRAKECHDKLVEAFVDKYISDNEDK